MPNAVIQQLLENELLSAESKQTLQESIQVMLQEAIDEAKISAREEATIQLTEQWQREQTALVDSIDQMVEDALKEQIQSLNESIQEYHDLKVDYEFRLQEIKEGLSEQTQQEIQQLVEHLDNFLDLQLTAEFNELRDDIAMAKRQHFGKKIFEAFSQEFKLFDLETNTNEAEIQRLRESALVEKQARETLLENVAKLRREVELEKVLRPLTGRQRQVMESMLQNTPAEKLVESYKANIDRVIFQGIASMSRKNDPTLTESFDVPAGIIKDGSNKQHLSEGVDENFSIEINQIRKLAGISEDPEGVA